MKIISVETAVLDAPLEKPWRFSTFTVRSVPATLIRIRTDDGLSGTGEAFTRISVGAIESIVHEILAPVVLDKDPHNVEAIWESMYGTMRARGHTRGFMLEAMSGVDIALWDLLGQAAGKPTWQILGGHGRTQFAAYASYVMMDKPEIMARDAAALAARGYTAIKIKLGDGLRRDIPRLEAVRAAVGGAVDLMIDLNAGLDPTDSIALGRVAERLGVYWLEEPVMADDLPGYARIRKALHDIRLSAGECEFTVAGVRPFLEQGLLDVLQPDIARAGGFTGCRRIAALADAYGVAVSPHTGLSGPVAIAASMHLACAVQGFVTFENMVLDNPLRNTLEHPLQEPRDGLLDAPQGPGLGLTFSDDVLKQYALRPRLWRASTR